MTPGEKEHMSWVKRVEAIIALLKGSSIEEIELAEGELEIIVRRNPGNIITVRTPRQKDREQENISVTVSASRVLDMKSPLTGIYYAASAPTASPFINVGDIITVGQTVALIEAMKVFNEIPSEIAGRVATIKVHNGDVVKKGDVLFQVEPA